MRQRARALALSFLAVGAFGTALHGQAGHVLHGRIVAAQDSTPLADVDIRVKSSQGAVLHLITDAAGRFEATTRGEEQRVIARRLGFAPETAYAGVSLDSIELRMRTTPFALNELHVEADRSYSASSAQVIRRLDLLLRPRESSQELLQLVPGLVTAQHAGGGKAEQIFLRGFDADHGTDVSISVDGVPVNIVSHAHGQGYADLHFLIPEVVDTLGPCGSVAGAAACPRAIEAACERRHSAGSSFDVGRTECRAEFIVGAAAWHSR